jgi:hypothetical protein
MRWAEKLDWKRLNTIMMIHSSIKHELGLIRPHNHSHKLYVLIYHLLKPFTKLHSEIRVVVIYCVQ